jgi:choline dehydrogenase-like flavoprotein
MLDVVIVGAGPAGLNAALLLGRARRQVLVGDAGAPRNAPVAHLHGFLSRDGLPPAWHNHYPLDRTLETVRWETATVSRVLGTRATALLCVHGAHAHGGGLDVHGVAIVPAHLLRGALGFDRALSDADVALLATSAWSNLRPAA